MLRNKSIFQISTLVCLSSISICNLLIDLHTYKEIVARNVHEQYCDLKCVAAEKLKTDWIRHFTDLINDVLKDDQFRDIQILLDIYGAFETWSVDCGGGFRLKNFTKFKSRYRLKVGRFDDLTRIKSYNLSRLNNSIDYVNKHLVTNKKRRETLPTTV
jgi:hypothetical protein